MKSRKIQTLWQLAGYIFLFLFGVWRMYDEDQLHYLQYPWKLYDIADHLNYYSAFFYEIEIGWYLSSLICTLINRDAKDFRAMLFHHLITPFLIYFSYHCEFESSGIAVMVLHDTSDVFLHAAKAFHNQGYGKITDITFVIFAIVFFITRLLVLPWVPWGYFFYSSRKSTCCAIMACVLATLCLLHLYWFTLIVQMIIKFAKHGEVEGDIRDDEAIKKEKSEIKIEWKKT